MNREMVEICEERLRKLNQLAFLSSLSIDTHQLAVALLVKIVRCVVTSLNGVTFPAKPAKIEMLRPSSIL